MARNNGSTHRTSTVLEHLRRYLVSYSGVSTFEILILLFENSDSLRHVHVRKSDDCRTLWDRYLYLYLLFRPTHDKMRFGIFNFLRKFGFKVSQETGLISRDWERGLYFSPRCHVLRLLYSEDCHGVSCGCRTRLELSAVLAASSPVTDDVQASLETELFDSSFT